MFTAPLRMYRALCFILACLVLCVFAATPAIAQESGQIYLFKTEGVGAEGEAPVQGAQFEARQLHGLEAANEDELNQMVVRNPELLTTNPSYEFGPVHEALSDSNGMAVFTGLEPGVYQVTERAIRTSNVYEALMTPTLILVDSTTPDVLRSKNQPLVIEKSTDAVTAYIGDIVTYTLATNIAQPDNNGRLHQFVILDELDHRLDFATISDGELNNTTGTTSLQQGEDYTVSHENGLVEIAMTTAGLRKTAVARDGHPETRATFSLNVRINDQARSGDVITNIAEYSSDGYWVRDGALPSDVSLNALGTDVKWVPVAVSTNVDDATPERSNEITIRIIEERPEGSSLAGTGWLALPMALGLGWLFNNGSSETSSELGQAGENEPTESRDSSGEHSHSGDSRSSEPTAAGVPDSDEPANNGLAETGANVLVIAAVGLVALLMGIALVAWRRNEGKSEEAGTGTAK